MTTSPQRRDTILVVDDAPDTLSLLTDALERAGMTVLIATDGESALALIERVTPDLILMDAIMPGLDGFQTCIRLRQDKHSAHVPVIFMTGLSETEHIVRGLNAGGVDYVTKPIVVDELIARIGVHLTNARIAHGARTALDATGRCLFAIDEASRLIWCTPQAEHLLSAFFPASDGGLPRIPTNLGTDLDRLRTDPQCQTIAVHSGTRNADIAFISRTGQTEFLFRIMEIDSGGHEKILRQTFQLTAREAEVLVCLAAGNSNRDIGQILGISPRTVNKHLEQIFLKLGVENRATAAAKAVRAFTFNS